MRRTEVIGGIAYLFIGAWAAEAKATLAMRMPANSGTLRGAGGAEAGLVPAIFLPQLIGGRVIGARYN
jgi:hypothetical protein